MKLLTLRVAIGPFQAQLVPTGYPQTHKHPVTLENQDWQKTHKNLYKIHPVGPFTTTIQTQRIHWQNIGTTPDLSSVENICGWNFLVGRRREPQSDAGWTGNTATNNNMSHHNRHNISITAEFLLIAKNTTLWSHSTDSTDFLTFFLSHKKRVTSILENNYSSTRSQPSTSREQFLTFVAYHENNYKHKFSIYYKNRTHYE